MVDLLAAYGLTEADVLQNTLGRLVPVQQRRLRRMAAAMAALSLGLAAALAVVWFAAVDRPVLWWQWLLAIVLDGALLAVGGRRVGRLLLAARAGEVVRHTGQVEALARRGKQLRVDGLGYSVPVAFDQLVVGESYDVYVVEPPAVVVAIVPTQGPPPVRG